MSFAVKKLAKFSSNTGKVNFEGLVHLLRYMIENKTLGLKYYADMKYATLSELLRQANIKTENKLIVFSDYNWQYFPDVERSKGSNVIFYQGGTIDHYIHVPGPVAQ